MKTPEQWTQYLAEMVGAGNATSNQLDAAFDACRRDAIEACARVAENENAEPFQQQRGYTEIAAAIRALKDTP